MDLMKKVRLRQAKLKQYEHAVAQVREYMALAERYKDELLAMDAELLPHLAEAKRLHDAIAPKKPVIEVEVPAAHLGMEAKTENGG